MMTKTFMRAVLLTASFISFSVIAIAAGENSERRDDILESCDTDSDTRIDKSELDRCRAAVKSQYQFAFDNVDKDKDGIVTRAELDAALDKKGDSMGSGNTGAGGLPPLPSSPTTTDTQNR